VPNAPEAPVEPEWLPDDDVDALFSRLTPFSKLAIAVSGGADSLCLMVLLKEWSRRTSWPGTFEVLCVDHGLRAESAVEAAFVARSAEELGLPSTILRWTGDRPERNLQEEARNARYRLMAEHMRGSGAQALVLAHHLDDQAETFLDRLTRGSGVTGLGAMAQDEAGGPSGLRLLRPLLSVRKRRLEASLKRRGMTWCSDPSNADAKYKRSRLRALMDLLATEGLSAERIARTAANMQRADAALQDLVRSVFTDRITEHPAGPLRLERQAYRSLAEEVRLRLLAAMIARVTGRAPRPRLRKLAGLDAVLNSDNACGQPLAGALFQADAAVIFCWREPGRTPPETLTGPTGAGVWDRRYRYRVVGEAEMETTRAGLRLGPLGAAPLAAAQVDWPQGWPKAAFDCAPAIWSDGDAVRLPFLGPETDIGSFCRCEEFELERLPFQVRLAANFTEEIEERP